MSMRCPKCKREDVAAYAESRPCSSCREKKRLQRKVNAAMRECGNNHAAADRLIIWMRNKSRMPASSTFTEGPERLVAYTFEDTMRNLVMENEKLKETLRLIATPGRKDGTWNRSREACQKIAEEALK